MQPRRTATTANALLGLLALRPSWPIYDLTKQLRRNMRFFWPRAESRIYDEAKSLVRRGWATAETSGSGRRRRTVYSITDAGREQLRGWLAMPASATQLECEPLLRVFLMDFSTREAVLAALAQAEVDARAIFDVGRVVGREYLAGDAPFQDQVHARALVFDFLSGHALMLQGWASRARATLADYEGMTSDQRAQHAQRLISVALARFPAE